MKPIVSKARTKNTRTRERQAGKAAAGRTPFSENRLVGVGIALLLWVCVLLLFGIDGLVGGITDATIFQLVGRGAFLAIGLFASTLFLKVAHSRSLENNMSVLMLCLISLVSLLAVKGVLYLAESSNLIHPDVGFFVLPLAIAPLLATILAGGAAGAAVGFWTSFAVAVFNRGSFPLFCSGILATVICAAVAPGVRTRSKVLKIGVTAGLSKVACVFGMTALNWAISDVMLIVHQSAASIASGLLSAVVVLLILPLFEWLFHKTTDLTLLELSDLGHPLLQRLALEAPGTYHHSLVVANLAQAAADEIGANSLLARVCAYFHDIGKLVKPAFFAENIQLQRNPHDDLPPSMSTLVITAHVKEGLSLALLHNLPDPVKAVILEHHGTSVLSYFHHKATSQLQFEEITRSNGTSDQSKVEEGSFRYQGPRPTSRESAIIHLADSVEAASRSIEKNTPGHIESLVQDIVDTRLRDGQLDQSNLTLNELVKIKSAFVFTLTNMLHGRIAYPKDESRNKQQSKRPQSGQAAVKEADGTSDGQGRRTERHERVEPDLPAAHGQQGNPAA